MTDALSGRQCIIISAVRPLCSHLISEVLIEKEYTKEMREWIRVDMELRYIDADFEYLSDLASFLDLRFKF